MDGLEKYKGWSKTRIINAIRREWMTCRQKRTAIERHVKRIELPNGQKKSLVECQDCKRLVLREDAQCHHLDEVGSLASTALLDIHAYRERMFCRASRLAPYCKECHYKHHHNEN